jgi:hypothetical protein
MESVILRPSGSSRWLKCPSSIPLEKRAEPVKSVMEAAAQGTAAHQILEMCIKNKNRPDKYIGETVEVYDEVQMEFPLYVKVNHEMVEALEVFLKRLDNLDPKDMSAEHSELSMEHSRLKGLRGTADYVRISLDRTHLWLYDLKYGRSIVQAVNRAGEVNTQLLSYAALLFDKFPKLETAEVAIIQPRGSTKKKFRSAQIDRCDIDTHVSNCRRAQSSALNVINLVEPIGDHLKTGSHCFFCRAKIICPALQKETADKLFGEN